MAEKKKGGLILVIILLILICVTLGYFAYKFYQEKESSNVKVEELNSQIVNLENTVKDLQDKIDNASNALNNSNSKDAKDTKVSKDNQTSKEISKEEFIGKWNTRAVIDENGNNEDLRSFFGSSISYGSYLQLNEDGTFLDSIQPITPVEICVEGKYEIENNKYLPGDCYVILNYNDGTIKKFRRAFGEDGTTPILTSYENNENYQYELIKK